MNVDLHQQILDLIHGLEPFSNQFTVEERNRLLANVTLLRGLEQRSMLDQQRLLSLVIAYLRYLTNRYNAPLGRHHAFPNDFAELVPVEGPRVGVPLMVHEIDEPHYPGGGANIWAAAVNAQPMVLNAVAVPMAAPVPVAAVPHPVVPINDAVQVPVQYQAMPMAVHDEFDEMYGDGLNDPEQAYVQAQQ